MGPAPTVVVSAERRVDEDKRLGIYQEAGRSHTVIITHSQEVQEMIGQKIEMQISKEIEHVQV